MKACAWASSISHYNQIYDEGARWAGDREQAADRKCGFSLGKLQPWERHFSKTEQEALPAGDTVLICMLKGEPSLPHPWGGGGCQRRLSV